MDRIRIGSIACFFACLPAAQPQLKATFSCLKIVEKQFHVPEYLLDNSFDCSLTLTVSENRAKKAVHDQL